MSAISEAAKIPGEENLSALTPDQQKALATDRNISVTAGAGSGKTTILVERYLNIILEEGVDVRAVLAITFTDKAAAEMTERVAQKIDRLLRDERHARQHQRLLQLRERLNSAQISTIHAFAAKILREFAVAAEIDPDFSVLNEFTRTLFTREAIDEVFTRLNEQPLQSPYSPEEWKELLRQIPPDQLKKILTVLLEHPYELAKLRQRFEKQSDEELGQYLQERFFELLSAAIDISTFLEEILPLVREIIGNNEPSDELSDNARELMMILTAVDQAAGAGDRSLDLWQALMKLSARLSTNSHTAYRQISRVFGKFTHPQTESLVLQLSNRLLPLHQFCSEVVSLPPGKADRLFLEAFRKILFLEQLTREIYREKKEERGFLDFEDLQILALKLLQEHPEIRHTLRNRYRYIMVDEFQDTNQLQWELISLLGSLDGELEEAKFFVVGDPKQSIYGFRNADVRVFRQVKTEFAALQEKLGQESGNILLGDSFRFLPSINRFINLLFDKILGIDEQNPYDVPYEPLMTRRSVEDTGYIELAFLDQEKLRESGLSQEDYLACTIRELLNSDVRVYRKTPLGERLYPIRPGDIAILIPRRNQLLELEFKLRKYGVPFKTIGGMGFYRRQEIHDVYHLLRLLTNPADNLALVAVLRSPFAGVSDAGLFYLSLEKGETYRQKLENIGDLSQYPKPDQQALRLFREQLTRWEQRRDRLSLSRFLDEVFEESFYRAAVAAQWNGEQLLANLDKIIEQARDYEQSGFIAMQDFIQSLHQMIDQDPREGEAQLALEDTNTVKIMTIHKAKGLEFPVVFCPYLQQTVRGKQGGIQFDPDEGLAAKIRDPEQEYRATTPFLYEWLKFRESQREIVEVKRLFYVVVTRARDRVYLVGDWSTKGVNKVLGKDNPLSWTAEALQLDLPAASNSPLEIEDGLQIQLTTTVAAMDTGEIDFQNVQKNLKTVQKAIQRFAKEKSPRPEEAHSELPMHLRPVKSIPEGVVFSATQLLTFMENPPRYFQRYHLGFFESDYEFVKQIGDPDSVSLLKGKIVHYILENGLPQNPAEILERLDHAFFHYEVFDTELQEELRKEIPNLLLPFRESEFGRRVFAATEYKTEISITMRLGKDYFTGTLDRIFLNEAHQWEVVDYKTNRVSAGEVESAGKKYEMQMKGYGLLVARLFPEQPLYPVSLYFLRPEKIYSKIFTPEDIVAIEREFTDLIEEIRQFYPFGEKTL